MVRAAAASSSFCAVERDSDPLDMRELAILKIEVAASVAAGDGVGAAASTAAAASAAFTATTAAASATAAAVAAASVSSVVKIVVCRHARCRLRATALVAIRGRGVFG